MIETQRLLLRPYGTADFAAYWAMMREPVAGFASRQTLSEEDAWQRILAAAGHWSLLGYGMFAVTDRASGAYLGETGLLAMRRGLGARFAGCDEAGWYLNAGARGRGLGFEAAAAAHDWYAREIGGRRTFCIVDRLNAPSVGLARKLGYDVAEALACGGHDLLVCERTVRAAATGQLLHEESAVPLLH